MQCSKMLKMTLISNKWLCIHAIWSEREKRSNLNEPYKDKAWGAKRNETNFYSFAVNEIRL